MTIYDAYLSELTDSQVTFSASFLEDVFLHKKTGLMRFRPDDFGVICSLIKSVPSHAMKLALLKALDTPIQVQVAQKMEDRELQLAFGYHDDLMVLRLIFQSLPDSRKEGVIQLLFQNDKKKFNELKPLMESSRSLKEEDSSHKSDDIITRIIPQEIKTLLTLIVEPKYSILDLKEQSFSAEKHIPIEHFESISRRIITEFMRLNIPLSNKETFAAHIKFYTFLVPYITQFPTLNTVVLHPVDNFLNALDRLPNGVWVVKVINQLPHPIIELCIDRLKSHPRIPELQKRSIYSKLLTILYENMHINEGAQIRAILEG